MTLSHFSLDLKSRFARLSTRPQGAEARDVLRELLASFDHVEIDMGGAIPTPSFIDEFLGPVARDFGAVDFHRRIRLANVNPEVRPLVVSVLRRRFRESPQTESEGTQLSSTEA